MKAMLCALALLAGCDVGIDQDEPLEAHVVIEIVTEDGLDQCELRWIQFALWYSDSYGAGLTFCSSPPADLCVVGLDDTCGVAVDRRGDGYCLWPVIGGCGSEFSGP